MADLSTVRTEIKTWERTFKSINQRDPSIQDIREQPAIGTTFLSSLLHLSDGLQFRGEIQAVQEAIKSSSSGGVYFSQSY
jgi:hypothetical protein